MTRDDQAVLDALVKALVDALRPMRIVLFGSRARGEAKPDSDWDLLVVAESNLPRFERAHIAQRAIWETGAAADILVFTPEEVERYRDWRSVMPSIALREGKVVYEAA